MKHLKTLLTLAKVGKVLSTIVFVICIVAAALTAASVAVYSVWGNGVWQWGGVTIKISGFDLRQITPGVLYALMGLLFAAVIVEIIIAAKAKGYFKHVLAQGTPFTFPLAAELKRLGLLCVITEVVLSIAGGIITAFIQSTGYPTGFHFSFSIGLGVAFLVVSAICGHGAEIAQTAGPGVDPFACGPQDGFRQP